MNHLVTWSNMWVNELNMSHMRVGLRVPKKTPNVELKTISEEKHFPTNLPISGSVSFCLFSWAPPRLKKEKAAYVVQHVPGCQSEVLKAVRRLEG